LFIGVGCGNGKGAEAQSASAVADKTFQGDGYSFTYPGAWAEQGAQGTPGQVDVLVGPPEGGQNAVSLKVLRGAVGEPVTDANIDQAMPALRPAVDRLMQRTGGVLEGDLEQVTYAGLPGLRFEASSTGLDPVVHLQGTWLFDGTTAYTFHCQSIASGAQAVADACDLVLGSFKVSG
jgi:hypothetical protein